MYSLRQAYFGICGHAPCDGVETPAQETPDVPVFFRGCTHASRVTVFANFHTTSEKNLSVAASGAEGSRVVNFEAAMSTVELEVSGLLGATCAARPRRHPPRCRLCQANPLGPSLRYHLHLVPPLHSPPTQTSRSRCVSTGQRSPPSEPWHASSAWLRASAAPGPGSEAVGTLTAGDLAEGFHVVEVNEGAASRGGLCSFSVFLSTLLVTARPPTVSHPELLARPGFICGGLSKFCHDAAGANAFRGQHDGGAWTEWQPYRARG